jgi:unsaturated rhamnogalacturonyl hydrolase
VNASEGEIQMPKAQPRSAYVVFLLAAGLLAVTSEPTSAATTAPEVRAVMTRVNDYWLARNSNGNAGWKRSTYWYGDVAAYVSTSKAGYHDRAHAWATTHSYGAALPQTGAAAAPGLVFVWLSELHHDPSQRAAMVTSFRTQAASTTLRYKIVDDMFGPFHIIGRIGALEQDDMMLTRNLETFRIARGSYYDAAVRLWWRDTKYKGQNVYWSRGNGWAFAGLSRVMAVIGPSGPGYSEYLAMFRDMAAVLRARQRSDGFWNTSLTNPSVFPGPETSGTALFAAGFAWGIRSGVLDRATYLPVVQRAWNGMETIAVQPSGALGYVQPEAEQPGPSLVTDGADFGYGVFLAGGWQVAELYASTATPTPTPTPSATPTPVPPGGYFRIMARHSGKAVSVQAASTANAANVFQWTYEGGPTNDEWQLVDLGNGYHRIVNRNSGKVLNVAGAATANGANVDQWSWANVNQQMWTITDLGNGYHRFTARHSGKVLNVAGASTADGADVDQWSWANVDQQQFQLVAVP